MSKISKMRRFLVVGNLFPCRSDLPVAMPIQPVRASECNGGWRSYPPICLVQTRNTGYL